MIQTQKTVLYEGFIIPENDARELRVNHFLYDAYCECFRGKLETDHGRIDHYMYFPEMHYWHLEIIDPDEYPQD